MGEASRVYFEKQPGLLNRTLESLSLRRQRALRERAADPALRQAERSDELERAAAKLRIGKGVPAEALRLFDYDRESFHSAYEETRKKDPRLDAVSFLRTVNSGLFTFSTFNPYPDQISTTLKNELLSRSNLAAFSSPSEIRLLYRLGKMDLKEGRHIAYLLRFIARLISDLALSKELPRIASSLFERDRFEYLKRGFQYISEFFQKLIEQAAKEEKARPRTKEVSGEKAEEEAAKKKTDQSKRKEKEVSLAIEAAKSKLVVDSTKPEELILQEAGKAEDRIKLLEIVIEVGRLTKPLRAIETRTSHEAVIRTDAEKLVWECSLRERALFANLTNHAETLKIARAKMEKQEGRPIKLFEFLRRVERGLSEIQRVQSPGSGDSNLTSLQEYKQQTSIDFFALAYQWGKYAEKIQTDSALIPNADTRQAIVTEFGLRLPAPTPENSALISSQLQTLESYSNLSALIIGCKLSLSSPAEFNSLSRDPRNNKLPLSSLIEAGKVYLEIQSRVSQALESQAIAPLAEIIMEVALPKPDSSLSGLPHNETEKILGIVLAQVGTGAINQLLTIRHEIGQAPLPTDAKIKIGALLDNIISSITRNHSHEALPALLNSLIQHTYKAEGWFRSGKKIDRESLQLELNLLEQYPELIPQLLKTYGKYHSFIKTLIAKFMRIFGLQAGRSDRIFEELIDKLTRSAAGQAEAISYISEPSTAQLPRTLLLIIIKNILKADKADNQSEKLIAALIGLSKENPFLTTENLISNPLLLKSLLYLASALVQFTELAEQGNIRVAVEKLIKTIQAAEKAKIKIPLLAFSHPGAVIQSVSQLAKNDLPYIIEKVAAFQADKELWEKIVEELKKDAGFGLYVMKYAYCFLLERGGNSKREGEELKSLLASENGRSQLFLTLQKIPTVLKEELLNQYGQMFRQIGKDELFVELLVFWNLLNSRLLDERVDRRQVAADIIKFIREDWDKGELWSGLLKLAEEDRFDQLDRFFNSLVDKIMEIGKGMDMEKLATQENLVFVGRNPFKKNVLPWSVGMALRSTETLVFKAVQGEPRAF